MVTPITLSDWDEVLIVVALSLWLGEKEIEFLEQNWAWKRFDFELNFGFHESTSVDEAQGMLLNTCWYLPCFENAIWLNIAWWVVVARWYPAKELKINYDFIFFKSVFVGTNEMGSKNYILWALRWNLLVYKLRWRWQTIFFVLFMNSEELYQKISILHATHPTPPQKTHTHTYTKRFILFFFIFCPFF